LFIFETKNAAAQFFFAVEKIFEVHFRFCMSFIFEVLQS